MFDRQAESIVGKTLKATGHILDLYCVRLSNTVPFFEIMLRFILMQNT